ncbi:MAG: 30S ribosomal protein S8 [Nanoarchaeota archaeon]|nr:30S ribosomal protein S8 [Nanoarchaeota archaeon]
MSQDIISDVLNEIMNIKKAGKKEFETKKYSKFLLEILKIAKENNYIEDFSVDKERKKLKIKIGELSVCKSIKPRYFVQVSEIEKYMRRFLPSRNFGIILLSTSSGLITHTQAYEKNIGGSLIAYFY